MRTWTAIALCAGLWAADPAWGHGQAHEHGHSRLQIVADSGTVAIEWRIPMGDAVGFEGSPPDAAAEARLTSALTNLAEAMASVQLAGAGPCQPPAAHAEVEGSGAHPDILVAAQWTCEAADQLLALAFDPWALLRGHERITAEWLLPAGQGQARWTAPATRLVLSP
jgi:hypothetical protein